MRPLGVTLAAAFQFFRGTLVSLLAFGILLVTNISARIASLAAEGNMLERFLSGFGKFLGIALLLYAALQIVLGVGLLFLQNWSRVLTIVFSILGIVILLPRLVSGGAPSKIFAILHVLVILYLLLPQTKAAFVNKRLPGSSSLPPLPAS